jgi:hypothetical protein
MKKNYTQRLAKLKNRRYDDHIQKAILSESFSDITIGESVKYALESMSEIDPKYTKATYVASENIQNHLTPGLRNKGLTVEYRHQGSVETNMHIKLHSDIDILVFTDKYHAIEPPLPVPNPYLGDPLADLKELRVECFRILDSVYNQVDNTHSKAIRVFPTNPKRKVDVVLSNWFNTVDWHNSSNEKHRGIHVYDKDKHTREKDYPFLHISNVNLKDSIVNGGLRKLVRLLKTLKVDADFEIKISSFEITSIVYDMSNLSLNKSKLHELLLLNEASTQFEKLINDKTYRENLVSPNGMEIVFGADQSKVLELKKLKLELDELIQDIAEELASKAKRINEPLIYH